MSALHEILARASAWLWPALANHLWQATLFAALALGVTLLLRRGAPARLRYSLWLVAALKFAAPSALFAYFAAALGLDSLWRDSEGAAAPLFMRIAEPVTTDSPDLVVGVSAARGHEELLCVLTLVWLAGCAALALVWFGKRREFLRSVCAGREAWAGREFEALARARARLGLRREVLLVLSEARTEPGVWRTRRPVLLLPSEVAAQLDDEELEAVVLHELAHVERRDNLCANLLTALACVFWFNPVVWLVGRKLFAERESACDERVLEAGGGSGAYAAGILKVVRFCSGWRVAGVAGVASGSNLRRRIEMIMLGEKGVRVRAWHRATLSGLAAVALTLTVGTGLFGRGTTTSARMLEGSGGEPQEGGRVVARSGQRGAESREQESAVREVVEQSPESGVQFEQAPNAPVQITEARMRMVAREQLRRADGRGADSSGDEESGYLLTLPTVTVSNTSAKAAHEIGVGFETSGRVGVVAGYAAGLRPGESKTFRSEWGRRNVLFPGTFADVKVRVVWVEFEDGTTWGTRMRARVPPPPPPPDAPGVPEPPARG
ncbi:MAG: M56 family metallopeptidase, partial [Acidobacteria bacterium]|nr:M56 family metallopeptidase [Acidobacteriota bacterium]